jgi:hypothetical protein
MLPPARTDDQYLHALIEKNEGEKLRHCAQDTELYRNLLNEVATRLFSNLLRRTLQKNCIELGREAVAEFGMRDSLPK